MLFQATIHQILMLRRTGRKLALYLMKMEILDIAIYQNKHPQSCCPLMEMLTLNEGFLSAGRFWKTQQQY